MPNLCGSLEECFENGIEVWGHVGALICAHGDGSGNPFVCPKTGRTIEPQNVYVNQSQYDKLMGG